MPEPTEAEIEAVARAIYSEFENRPVYAQAQMNGVLASELARAAILALDRVRGIVEVEVVGGTKE